MIWELPGKLYVWAEMQWAQSMGVAMTANKKMIFEMLLGRAEQLEA